LYVVLVYDVEQERVGRVCQYLKRYLHWVQESVFEGELSEGRLEKLKAGLLDIIDREKDSVYIYKVREKRWLGKEVVGVEKALTDRII